MTPAAADASVAAKWVVEETHGDHAGLRLAFDARPAPDHCRAGAVNLTRFMLCVGDRTA